MKKFNAKTYLKLLMVVGLIAVVGGSAGTFASFTAETTNANTFATGTLVLSNKVESAAACLSTGGGTTVGATNSESASCTAFFNTSLSKPGDTSGGNLVLKNDGTLDPSKLTLVATCATVANTGTYTGTGDLCDALQITVQEWTNNTFASSAAVSCLYGAATANVCDFTDLTKTAGALATSTGTTPLTLASGASTLTAGSSRYYTVSVKLPSTVDNTYQGRKANVSLSWKEVQ